MAAGDASPYGCAFEKTIIIGNSVSSNGLLARVNDVGFGESPGIRFVNEEAKREIFKKLAVTFPGDSGGDQAAALLTSRLGELAQATAIIGVDAFYMDASFGNFEAAEIARSLIDYAARTKKTLVLGTVPTEDKNHVFWTSMWMAPVNYALDKAGLFLWNPPDVRIARTVNDAIKHNCFTTNGCYVVDLAAMAAQLNRPGGTLAVDGKSYDVWKMRTDGVNLSPLGSRYVLNEMRQKLKDNPPPAQPLACGMGKPLQERVINLRNSNEIWAAARGETPQEARIEQLLLARYAVTSVQSSILLKETLNRRFGIASRRQDQLDVQIPEAVATGLVILAGARAEQWLQLNRLPSTAALSRAVRAQKARLNEAIDLNKTELERIGALEEAAFKSLIDDPALADLRAAIASKQTELSKQQDAVLEREGRAARNPHMTQAATDAKDTLAELEREKAALQKAYESRYAQLDSAYANFHAAANGQEANVGSLENQLRSLKMPRLSSRFLSGFRSFAKTAGYATALLATIEFISDDVMTLHFHRDEVPSVKRRIGRLAGEIDAELARLGYVEP